MHSCCPKIVNEPTEIDSPLTILLESICTGISTDALFKTTLLGNSDVNLLLSSEIVKLFNVKSPLYYYNVPVIWIPIYIRSFTC